MVKMDWRQFQRTHPEPARALLGEYHGFASTPVTLEFEVLPTTTCGPPTGRASSRTWDPHRREWLS